MRLQTLCLALCSSFTVLTAGCATEDFVQTQVGASESKLTQRADTQETKLRETETKLRETEAKLREAEAKLRDTADRAHEVGALANDAQARAISAHDAQARLAQRLADRNKFRLLDTGSIYFDSGKTDIRDRDTNELEDAAKTLKADANVILELQGFADPRGNDRDNNELARERVEAVIRYLVQRHGIELRQLRAVAMGKVALVGEKPSTEALAKARRVDIRLLVPWSTWEDPLTPIDTNVPAQTSTVDPSAEAPSASRVADDQPATLKMSGRPAHDRDALKTDAPGKVSLREFLKTISPKELGGTEE
jgi:outer membrane protein OmpA-like peptidoglycan-associated protein